jgi:hypothetical protein
MTAASAVVTGTVSEPATERDEGVPMHPSGRRALLAASTIVGTAAALVLGGGTGAGASTDPVLDTGILRTVSAGASLNFPATRAMGTPKGIQSHELAKGEESDGGSETHISPTGVPVVSPTPVAGAQGLKRSFQGLNGFDQRFANNGNQFSVEPPDQGLCANSGYVFEVVNDVLRIYRTGGTAASGVTDLNTFYGYAPQINRTTGAEGPQVTDPTCLFDASTHRWFVNALTYEVNPTTGDPLGPNHLDVAVSKTSNPLGGYSIFRLPVQDNGTQGTPSHAGCPCIGDYPHIATDKYGFYVTTNEYPWSSAPGIFGNNFNGAQIYAFDKAALAAGASRVNVVQFSKTALHQGSTVVPGFTLAPAQVPDSAYQTANNGTEYFLSSIAGAEAQPAGFTGQAAALGSYALTNTASLHSAKPAVKLTGTLRPSERYVFPPLSNQKPGPIPLGNFCTQVDCFGLGVQQTAEGPLDSNDTRMQQVYYAHGQLYAALDTGVQVNGRLQAGIAWFLVNPGSSPSTSRVAHQGYIGVAGQNVIFPAIAATSSGAGAMAYTLVGTSYYPSAGYSLVSSTAVERQVRLAAAGAGPQDGFTEYEPVNGPGSAPRPRWGDYGAAVPVGSTIWLGSEYIAQSCSFATYQKDMTCGNTRAPLINWSTRISAVTP